MLTKTYIHGWIIQRYLQKKGTSPILKEVFEKYQVWKAETERLNSENGAELSKTVKLLNEYKNYIDLLKENGVFKMQDKIASSVLEEFLFQLFKNIPNIILQRHMIMNYPEYNKVVSRLRFPKLLIADASAGHDVLWPADCVSDDIELSRQLEYTTASEPMTENPERPPIRMPQSEPVRQLDRNCPQFFSLRS